MSGELQQAMVLAAGLGTRMRPLTDHVPKPLVKVAGRTLLDRALDAVVGAGIPRAVVNAHYLADQIEAHLKTRSDLDLKVSDERTELLDSGGGVKAALPLLDEGRLAVLNADTFWCDAGNTTLRALGEMFDPADMDFLLLLAGHENAIGFTGAGDFTMDRDGRLSRRGEAQSAPYIYAGVAIVMPALLAAVEESAFSLNRLFDRAIEQGRLYGHVLDGLWLHVGTPDAILLAEQALNRFQLQR